MRKLAIFGFSFCAAVAAGVYGLPAAAGLVCAGILALIGGIAALLHRKNAARVSLICLGLAAGLIWTPVREYLFLQPAQKLAGEDVELTATLLEYPEASSYGASALALLSDGTVTAKAAVYLDSAALELEAGSVLTITGQVLTAAEAGSTTYQSEGAFLLAYTGSCYTVTKAEGSGLRTLPARVNHTLQEKIREIFPEDVYGLFLALLTGEKDELSDSTVSSMKAAGVYHTVAVSGMHVSILMGFVSLLIRRRRLRALTGIPLALCFLLLIGSAPGVTRAVTMQILLLLAALLQQEYDSPTALAAAALVMLAANPWAVTAAGFQLSFASTAGILLFSTRIYRAVGGSRLFLALEKHLPFTKATGNPLLNTIAASFGTSIGALSFSLPLLAYYYGTVALISPLSNLLLLWAITLCFTVGLIAAVFSLLLPGAGRVIAWLAAWPARYFLWGSGLLARIPFASVSISSGYILAWLVFIYLLVLLLLSRKRSREAPHLLLPVCCAVLTLGCSLLLSSLDYTAAAFSFSVLDVGQGQCLALSSGGVNIMIDCGGDDDAGDTAVQFLTAGGQTGLDALILTHFDSDHCNGVPELLRRVSVDVLYIPDVEDDAGNRAEILQAAAESGTPVCAVTALTTLSFSDCTLQIFPPLSLTDDNAACLSMLFTCGDFDALVTGDMDQSTEVLLLQHYDIPDLELLVVGHHGSAYATGTALLAATSPELAVISVGADNTYGHPTQAVLDRLAEIGAEIYRTDLHGTITVRSTS